MSSTARSSPVAGTQVPLTPQTRKTPQPTPGPASPASTMYSSHTGMPGESLKLPYLPMGPIASSVPSRPLVIRADPMLVSCFDPADKELYALWGPKN